MIQPVENKFVIRETSSVMQLSPIHESIFTYINKPRLNRRVPSRRIESLGPALVGADPM